MAAGDDKKAPDDPIARAMQRAAEKKAQTKVVPNVGGGMDAVGVTHRPKRADAPVTPKPAPRAPEIPFAAPKRSGQDEDALALAFEQAPPERSGRIEPQVEAPSFFSQSREERAEQARRAAVRVRRRDQDTEPSLEEPAPTEVPRSAPVEEAPVAAAPPRAEAPRPAPPPAPQPKPKPDAETVAPFARVKQPEPAPQPKPVEAVRPKSAVETKSIASPVQKTRPVETPKPTPAPAKPTTEAKAVETKSAPPFVRVKQPEPSPKPQAKPSAPSVAEAKPSPPKTEAPFVRTGRPAPASKPVPQAPATKATLPEVKPAKTGVPPSTGPKRPIAGRMTTLRADAARADAVAPAPKPDPTPPPAPKVDPTPPPAPEPPAKAPMIERALNPEPRVEAPKIDPREPAKKAIAAGGLGALIERVGEKQDAPRVEPAAKPSARADWVKTPSERYSADQAKPAEAPVFTPQPSLPTSKTKSFAPFEWMIASRYLRARKKEGFVSVIAGFSLIGIMLGVGALIVVMAVMSGFRATLIDQIVGVNPHISVTSQVGRFENYDTLATAIAEVDGVERATPAVYGQVLASGNRSHSVVFVRGTRKQDILDLKIATDPEASAGSLDEFESDQGVAIGANLAARLGLRVGDFITLISPDGDITPFSATPMPRKKDYRIIYTFKIGLYEYDNQFVLMPFEESQIYFNKKGIADALEVSVADPAIAETYVDGVRRAARQSISVETWKDRNGSFINALDIERKAMFVILTLIILVAALNIISGLVMLVKDKTRDIAIMRTMGMARGSVLRIFFICGASIGVVGSILGVVCGVLFVWNIGPIQQFIETLTGARLWDPSVRMLSEVPAKLVFSDVVLTLFIALALSFLATLYPAWKASKLDPVEALRYE